MKAEEHQLVGGNLSRVVRVGDTVRRSTGHWTAAVHALLQHLESRGFRGAPRVRGFDDQQREILTYLPGETTGATRPWPAWTRSDETLVAVAAWLRRYHRAVADFEQPAGTRWRLTDARAGAGEIVCHNDVAPYNVAWRGDGNLGVFDWDVASPGPPEQDVAFSAWNFVPLWDDAHCRALGWERPVERSTRLRAFLDAYGLEGRAGFVERIGARMQDSIGRIQHGADGGDAAFRRLVEGGHLEPVRAAQERLQWDATLLQRAID